MAVPLVKMLHICLMVQRTSEMETTPATDYSDDTGLVLMSVSDRPTDPLSYYCCWSTCPSSSPHAPPYELFSQPDQMTNIFVEFFPLLAAKSPAHCIFAWLVSHLE